MIIIPEIYLKNAKAIPLLEGSTNAFFNQDAVAFAHRVKDSGSDTIFLMDTNIAPTGVSPNLNLIKKIKNCLKF